MPDARIQPGKITYHACDQVWQIPELRDEILLHLPPRRLLIVRRVCKSWYDSPRANHVLFLNPGSGPRNQCVPDEEDEEASKWKTVTRTTPISRITTQPVVHQGGHELVAPPIANTILSELGWLDVDGSDVFFGALLVVRKDYKLVNTFGGESFLRMQLMYPPAQRISFTCLGQELLLQLDAFIGTAAQPHYSAFEWFDVVKDSGVTVRDLIEGMRAHFGSCISCIYECTDGAFNWRVDGASWLEDFKGVASGHQLLAAIRKRTIKTETESFSREHVAEAFDKWQEGPEGSWAVTVESGADGSESSMQSDDHRASDDNGAKDDITSRTEAPSHRRTAVEGGA